VLRVLLCRNTDSTNNLAIVDKTATHMSKVPNPTLLEEKIRENMKNDAKFSFLNDADPYHQYYRYMIEKVKEDAEDAAKGINNAPKVEEKKVEEEVKFYEPKTLEFKVDLPGVTAMDL
jgi:splicing factor 3A subunit 1